MPGLHAKYYDQGMLPLVEVVQDTCGRHDAFALACSAKYYDDIGYPGHSNCSENFNTALSKFNVKERPGWMAINFFFNTNIEFRTGLRTKTHKQQRTHVLAPNEAHVLAANKAHVLALTKAHVLAPNKASQHTEAAASIPKS